MPVVIPLVGAAAAWGMAGAAVSTIATVGFAALSVGEVFALTAAVGATIGAIGVVARDKTLQTVGAVIGGIGAIGGLASAAGLINGSAHVFGDAAAENALNAAIPPPNADFIKDLDTAVSIPQTSILPPPVAGATGVAALAAPVPLAMPQATNLAAAQSSGALAQQAAGPNLSDSAAAQAAAAKATAAAPQTAAAAPQSLAAQAAAAAPKTAAGAGVAAPATAAQAAPAAANKGISGVLKFMKDNESASYMLAQVGGQLVQGLFGGNLTAAQAANQASQAELNRATAAITNQQYANIASGMPIGQLKPRAAAPVTGAPAPLLPSYQAQQVGLINSSPVTGVPA